MSPQNPKENEYRRAEDLGPSSFDPHAPYIPVDPNQISTNADQPDNQEKNLAILAHLCGCLGFVVASVPAFIGPLVIWLYQKDKSAYVEQQAKEALNFQITLLLLTVVFAILGVLSCGMLMPLVFLLPILQVVFGIISTITVANGNPYRYPFNLRLIK